MKKHLLTMAATAGLLFTAYNDSASAHEVVHTVQSGDTLWKISQLNNVAVNDLISWNKLSSSTIYVNQKLTVLAPHSHTAENTISTYTVISGDTLWGIAKKYSLSVSQLKSMNNLISDSIYPGQKLKVTASSATPGTTSATYTVKSGDNLSIIAARNGMSVSELKSINNLKSDIIYPGQMLKLSSSANGSASNTSAVASATSSKVNELIAEAKKYIGVPYVWAGSTPAGFDCSGFLNYVYNKAGISIPRTVATIWDATKPVSALKAGDLVFYETYKAGPSHAGIYLGNNQFIHAGTSRGVQISDLNNSYWKPRFLGARTTF